MPRMERLASKVSRCVVTAEKPTRLVRPSERNAAPGFCSADLGRVCVAGPCVATRWRMARALHLGHEPPSGSPMHSHRHRRSAISALLATLALLPRTAAADASDERPRLEERTAFS